MNMSLTDRMFFLFYGKFYCIKQGTSDRNFVK